MGGGARGGREPGFGVVEEEEEEEEGARRLGGFYCLYLAADDWR